MIKNSKSGFTLVEVIVSTVILAIVIVSCVLAINSSAQMIDKTGKYESEMAYVQSVCDTLIEELETTDSITSSLIPNAINVTNSGFSFSEKLQTQYKIIAKLNGSDVLGYNITVRMYLSSADEYIEMTAYADANGGVWTVTA